jgi:hypothetical protein
MLQNRYGDREFPVRDRWSSVRVYRQAAMRHNPNQSAARNLIWLAPAIVLLIAVIGITHSLSDTPDGPDGDLVFLVGFAAFVVLVAVGLLVHALIDMRVPRREQQQYWALTGAQPITARQQQLLAFDAQSDFAAGGWNSSLDYAPAWSRMPAPLRQAHEQGSKRTVFVTMPLFEVAAMRAQLDTDHHIASRPDVELFVADALNDRSFSNRFLQVLHGPDGEKMLARLSSLTGINQWDLRALERPEDGLPPRLLWAADTQRVIAVVRMAHLADHLDTDTAWRLIEHATEPAAGLFESWDTYWANVRTGLAFWTDRLEVVQNFDHTLTALRTSNWPATNSPFPSAPVPTWLPKFTGTMPTT